MLVAARHPNALKLIARKQCPSTCSRPGQRFHTDLLLRSSKINAGRNTSSVVTHFRSNDDDGGDVEVKESDLHNIASVRSAAEAALAEGSSQVELQQDVPLAPVGVVAEAVPAQPPAGFMTRRIFIFLSIFIGYACYYITRTSLTYVAPLMVADKTLGLTLPQIGAMTSLFPLAYGFSKFLAGVLSARFSATTLLAGGLAATALTNIAFGTSSALPVFCGLWALNGILQGVGGPSCASILTNWWPAKERGTWWGLWSTAHNVGGFSAPLIVGYIAKTMGWRWGMWAAGGIGLAVAALIGVFCRDKPQQLGFPPVEAVVVAPPVAPVAKALEGTDGTAGTEVAAGTVGTGGGTEAAGKAPAKGVKAAMDSVLRNPFIWGLAVTYFFVYVVRQGVSSWFVFYLMDKAAASPADAALTMSGLELGGLCGGSFSGFLSDKLIRRARDSGGKGLVGKRIQVVMSYIVIIAAALYSFQHLPADNAALRWLNVFAIGFGIYGPQMLIGLCGAELVAPEGVGASQGVLGWIAYLGAANAGVPMAWLVQQQGWGAYFSALIGACGVALLLLAPMAGARSFIEKQTELKAASPAAA